MTTHLFDEPDAPRGPISWTVRATLWRIAASVLLPVGWVSATVLFLAFGSRGFSWAQDLAVGVVSFLFLAAALVLIWVSFGVHVFRRWVDS